MSSLFKPAETGPKYVGMLWSCQTMLSETPSQQDPKQWALDLLTLSETNQDARVSDIMMWAQDYLDHGITFALEEAIYLSLEILDDLGKGLCILKPEEIATLRKCVMIEEVHFRELGPYDVFKAG